MSTKKSAGGKHKKKRIGVNVPADWHKVMRTLAGKRKQPVLWYLFDLVKRDAEAAGIETPPLPWEVKNDAN